RTSSLRDAMRTYEKALHAERALMLASTDVTQADFEAFFRELNLGKDYQGMQGIGWMAAVPGNQRDAFEARARKDGVRGFGIKPAGRREAYYVVLYAEPGNLFGQAIGLDTRASRSLRAELELARDSGQTTISNKVVIGVDLDVPKLPAHRTAFALYVPIY